MAKLTCQNCTSRQICLLLVLSHAEGGVPSATLREHCVASVDELEDLANGLRQDLLGTDAEVNASVDPCATAMMLSES